MRKQIISVLTATLLSSSLLISCSNESNQQTDNKSETKMANKANIDPNTGMSTESNYYIGNDSATSNNALENLVSAPEPNNDTKLMDNPSAVNNAERNRQIASKNTVDSEPGYVDKPAAGNTIAGSDDQIVSNEIAQDNYENEEESKNITTLAQKNSFLLAESKKQLAIINEKLKPQNVNKITNNQELAHIKLQKIDLLSTISKLENDNKSSYPFTQELIAKNQINLDNQTASKIRLTQ